MLPVGGLFGSWLVTSRGSVGDMGVGAGTGEVFSGMGIGDWVPVVYPVPEVSPALSLSGSTLRNAATLLPVEILVSRDVIWVVLVVSEGRVKVMGPGFQSYSESDVPWWEDGSQVIIRGAACGSWSKNGACGSGDQKRVGAVEPIAPS